MDVYAAIVLSAVIAGLLNWRQMLAMRQTVEATKIRLASDNEVANHKLDEIHGLVNSRLTDALKTIEDLKALLLLALSETISRDDPRIKDAIEKRS